MQKIEALVDVLSKFGGALGNIKELIGDIEDEINKHTVSLKKEIAGLKKNTPNGTGESSTKQLLKEETELRERMSRLRMDIEDMEKTKNTAEDNQTRKISKSYSVRSSASFEEANGFHNDALSTDSKQAYIYSYMNTKALTLTPSVGKDWWKNVDVRDEQEEQIDWEKENADRVQNRLNLMVKEGWRKHGSSFEELQEALLAWTGKLIPWTVIKQGRAANHGKAMFTIRFESEEDRNKIFAMRKQIGEEGILLVGEALTYIERRERWKMLLMAEGLRTAGRDIEFENRKISVDGQWWKYDFAEGWKRVLD